MVRFWNRLTLLQRFTIASAAIAVALAVVLSAATVQAIQSVAVRDEAQVAAELVLRTIAPQLRPADFAGTLPPQRRALLDALFRAHGVSDRAQRISRTVWTAVPLGFFVLYGSVFVLVRRASQQLIKQQAALIAAHLGTYQSLASAIDAKDSYTGDHSTNVADLAARVGRALKLSPEAVDDVRIGARLHDLGKIGVPDAILMKPGPLDPDELVIMRRHAERGFKILQKAPLSDRVKLAVRHSHERWDGKGYPAGLAGEAIPLIARIVAAWGAQA